VVCTIESIAEGEWIGTETTQRVAANGVAVAVCTLHDHRGPIGSSTVCAVRNPRMTPFPFVLSALPPDIAVENRSRRHTGYCSDLPTSRQ
jgi:hypothetical protein